jgi:DsbC/DsbD-like thiol-disulfide interchange protein
MNFLQHLLVVALVTTVAGSIAPTAVVAGDQVITARLASEWGGTEVAKSRLIVAHAPHHHGKKLLAGLQFQLNAGWFTYWRTPGESGAPPEFDWSESENVADVKILWPRPQRVKVSDYTINGYPSGVVLPLVVTPENPTEPMVLNVKVTFAVCRDVCVPVSSEHELRLEAIESAIERQREAEEQAREAAREARERAREQAREARERAREAREEALEKAREAREEAQEKAQEDRERAIEDAAEARRISQEQIEEMRERIREAVEAAREKAEEFIDEARERAELEQTQSASARALEEKATRLAESAEAHVRAIEQKATALAQMHAQVIQQSAEATAQDAEARARALEEKAEDLAQTAEQLAEAYADLIERYVDMVPENNELEKKIEAAIGEVSERGGRRAIEIKILSDQPVTNPQVFVEADGKVVFGMVEAKVDEDGRTILVVAPISRAKGPVDGRWVTITVVDGQTAIEKRIKIARRDVVTLPWPATAVKSPDQPVEATPPIAALPE